MLVKRRRDTRFMVITATNRPANLGLETEPCLFCGPPSGDRRCEQAQRQNAFATLLILQVSDSGLQQVAQRDNPHQLSKHTIILYQFDVGQEIVDFFGFGWAGEPCHWLFTG